MDKTYKYISERKWTQAVVYLGSIILLNWSDLAIAWYDVKNGLIMEAISNLKIQNIIVAGLLGAALIGYVKMRTLNRRIERVTNRIKLFGRIIHWLDNGRFHQIREQFPDKDFGFFTKEEPNQSLEVKSKTMEGRLRAKLTEKFSGNGNEFDKHGTLTLRELNHILDCFCRGQNFWDESDEYNYDLVK